MKTKKNEFTNSWTSLNATTTPRVADRVRGRTREGDDSDQDQVQLQSQMFGDAIGTRHGTNGRWVVHVNHTHLFWRNGQERFCDVLRAVAKVSKLGEKNAFDSIHEDERVTDPSHSSTLVPLINMTIPCRKLLTTHFQIGQGNWVTGIYMVRMAATFAHVDLDLHCDTNDETTFLELLMPWFGGRFRFDPHAHDISTSTLKGKLKFLFGPST